MKTFIEHDRELAVRRVRRHRETLREAGLRPVQLWVIDTRAKGFGAECQRQCRSSQRQTCRRRLRMRWIKLRRGDLVAWSFRRRIAPQQPPEHGMVIQHDAFDTHGKIAIVPVARLHFAERDTAPLLNVAICDGMHAMIDQLRVIPRRSIRGVYGRVDVKSRLAVERALALFLGIAH
ncbi:MAG: antitoxin MazE-like protein [Steroidobacteraceae bacterium]